MPVVFRKATKAKAKLRLALDGPAGCGKTYTALQIASLLEGRIALIDSEHGSASLYSDVFSFDALDLESHSLLTYLEAIQAAAAGGYENLIVDSLSHAWNGKGGALEQVDKSGGSKFSNGWKTVTPLLARVIDALLAYPGNVICTMRTKTAYEVVTENGRAVPKKIGLAPVMRDGVEYEFGVVLDLTHEGSLSVAKTRCPGISGMVFGREDVPKVTKTLKAWLSDGATATPAEALIERIRFAANDAELVALVPELKLLTPEELVTVRPAYAAKKVALAEGAE